METQKQENLNYTTATIPRNIHKLVSHFALDLDLSSKIVYGPILESGMILYPYILSNIRLSNDKITMAEINLFVSSFYNSFSAGGGTFKEIFQHLLKSEKIFERTIAQILLKNLK